MNMLLGLLSLACVASQTLPDARELLKRSDDPVFLAKTVRLVGVSSVDTTIRGATRHANGPSFSYEFENNGKAREETKTGSFAEIRIFDGANLWQYRSATGTYTKSPSGGLLLNQQLADLSYGRESTNILSAVIEREEKLDFRS